MSVRVILLLFLLLLHLPAANPLEWERLLDAGVLAEDEGDYWKAKALLTRACQAGSNSPGSMRSSCLALARVHAVSGSFERADKVLEKLVKKLEATGSDNYTVEALLEWSDVQAARSNLDSAVKCLRDVVRLLPALSEIESARALTRMGGYPLAVNKPDVGLRMLHRAQAELLGSLVSTEPGAVAALVENAAVVLWNGQSKEAEALLFPVIERARKSFSESETVSDDLREAYLFAADTYSSLLRRSGQDDALEEFKMEVVKWRKRSVSNVTMVGGEVKGPRLIHKVEPAYTRGARAVNAQGPVILTAEIWLDGKAHNVRVMKRLPYGLTWSAIAAVREWRFQPGTKLGKPVKVAATIDVNFRLPKLGRPIDPILSGPRP